MNDENQGREDLRLRTKRFALSIIHLYQALPTTTEAQMLGLRVLRAGTLVGAHYRKGHRAPSEAGSGENLRRTMQQLEGSGYWLELLTEARIVPASQTENLLQEVRELKAIFTTILRSAKQR
jgi:four helix bundle protein